MASLKWRCFQVNVSVINDAHEGGVSFSRAEYVVETSEARRAGEALVALHAAGAGRLLYGLHAARAAASLPLFRLHELTGVLELAQPLDRSVRPPPTNESRIRPESE